MGSPGVFPQKLCCPGHEPGPAFRGAVMLERSLCRSGRSHGGREAQREGRSPCRLAPSAGDHLTAPGVSGRVGASTGHRDLPSRLSAGHPCPGNQRPQGGCDKRTGRCCKAGCSGPAGTLAQRVSAAARAPGGAADEGQMVPPPPGPLGLPITISTHGLPRGRGGKESRAGAGVPGLPHEREHPAGEKGPERLAIGPPPAAPGTAWLTAAWSLGAPQPLPAGLCTSLTSRSAGRSPVRDSIPP